MPDDTAPFKELTTDELAHVVAALAELAGRQRTVAAALRLAGVDNPTAALGDDLKESRRLLERLARELEDRRRSPTPFALVEQCDECGALEGQPHELNCPNRPGADDFPEPGDIRETGNRDAT